MSTDETNQPGPLTGWETTAPAQDTALRQFLLAQTAFQRITGEALGATIVETDQFIAVDTGRSATMLNFALLLQPLSGTQLAPVMQLLHDLFDGAEKRGFVGLYSPLPTPDLSEWGWNLAGHPPLQLRSPHTPLHDTQGIQVERVTDAASMEAFERVLIHGFEFEEMYAVAPGAYLPPAVFDDPRFAAYLAHVDGEPAAVAGSVTEAGIVDITMVATLPAARRRGAGLAVTQAAARPELGLPSILFSSDEGRPVYERLGFVPLLRGSFWYRNR